MIDPAAQGSFATYVVHPLILTAIMVLLAPLPSVPELKFALVCAAGVPACFAAGYALTRLPGASAVL